MGNVLRMASYPYAANARSAVGALALEGAPLRWRRLDDGVMGGRSSTHPEVVEGSQLRFAGEIDTAGGGFASVRAAIEAGLPEGTEALRLRLKGDGKTYKVLLSNGEAVGPFRANPSWQHDLATADGEWTEAVLSLSQFVPSIGGKASKSADLKLVPRDQKEVGLMLSLYKSDGTPNPPATFGTGKFPFDVTLASIAALKKEDL